MSQLQQKARELIELRRRATELFDDREPAAVAERAEVIKRIEVIQSEYGTPYFVRLVKSMTE